MSSAVIPKEQLSAYQRWEMTSFGDSPIHNSAPPPPAAPSAADIAAIYDNARLAGYETGHQAGLAQGLSEGQIEVSNTIASLQQIAESFSGEIERADELIAQDMLDLALDLSKAMLKNALRVRPELLLPVVKEAIHYLPTLHQPALLLLHPDDATMIKEHMGIDLENVGWRVVEDAQMERGGCRVETATNQIDASAPTRWQRIASSLGKDADWLAP
ncbi:MAG: flagellar assembly protein FliH [Pseudomonadota bacterium]